MLLIFCENELNDAHRWRNGGPRVVWGLPRAAAALPSLNRGGDEKLGWLASELCYCSIISYCSPTHKPSAFNTTCGGDLPTKYHKCVKLRELLEAKKYCKSIVLSSTWKSVKYDETRSHSKSPIKTFSVQSPRGSIDRLAVSARLARMMRRPQLS